MIFSVAFSGFQFILKAVIEFAWIWKLKELLHPLEGRLSCHRGGRNVRFVNGRLVVVILRNILIILQKVFTFYISTFRGKLGVQPSQDHCSRNFQANF